MKLKNIVLGTIMSLAIVTGFATQVDAAPIHDAAANGNLEALQQELTNGANVNAVDNDGDTALTEAAWWGHTGCVQALLDAGANVDATNSYGETALTSAAWWGHTEIVLALLEAGADATLQNNDGETALNLAHDDEIKDLIFNATHTFKNANKTS